jgi:hypothetical protein
LFPFIAHNCSQWEAILSEKGSASLDREIGVGDDKSLRQRRREKQKSQTLKAEAQRTRGAEQGLRRFDLFGEGYRHKIGLCVAIAPYKYFFSWIGLGFSKNWLFLTALYFIAINPFLIIDSINRSARSYF